MINLNRSSIENAAIIGTTVLPLNTCYYQKQDGKYKIFHFGKLLIEAPWTDFAENGTPFASEDDFVSYLNRTLFRALA